MRLPFQNRPDHSRAPVLDALQKFRERGEIVYGPPGHKQGRGVDARVLGIVGPDVFASDVLIMNGLLIPDAADPELNSIRVVAA